MSDSKRPLAEPLVGLRKRYRSDREDPVQMFLRTYCPDARVKFLSHYDIEGFLFLDFNRLESLYYARLSCDPNSTTGQWIVSGVVGSSHDTARVVSCPVDDIFRECYCFVTAVDFPVDATSPFRLGPVLDQLTLTKIHSNVALPIDDIVPDQPVHESDPILDPLQRIVSIPCVFPLLRGHRFRTGLISDIEVVTSFQDYYPQLSTTWFRAITGYNEIDASFAALDGFESYGLWKQKKVHKFVNKPSISFQYHTNGGVYDEVRARLPPSPMPPIRPTLLATPNPVGNVQQPIPVRRIDLHVTPAPPVDHLIQPRVVPDPTIIDIPEDDLGPTINTKFLPYVKCIKVFFSRLDIAHQTPTRVFPPHLRDEFMNAVSSSTSDLKSLYTEFQSIYMEVVDTLRISNHYLAKMVKGLDFIPSSVMFSLFIQRKFLLKPFASVDEVKELSTAFSLATFGEPDRHHKEYKQYSDNLDDNRADDVVDQVAERKTAVVNRMFPYTKYDESITSVLRTVASFLAFSACFVQFEWNEHNDNNPSVVNALLKLATLASHENFCGAVSAGLQSREYPSATHNVFLVFQDILFKFSLVTLKPKAFHAAESPAFPVDPSLYEPACKALTLAIYNFQMTIDGASLFGPLMIVTKSFSTVGNHLYAKTSDVIAPADTKRSHFPTPGKPQSLRQDDSPIAPDLSGWLIARGSAKHIGFKVPDLSVRGFCLAHAFKGVHCKFGSHCSFPHYSFLAQFSKDDQAKIRAFVDANKEPYGLLESEKPDSSNNKKQVRKGRIQLRASV